MKRAIVVSLLTAILLVGPAENAQAWGGATNINFDGLLSGYSETWRDWYDVTYLRQYDYWCECYIEGYTSAYGVAALYRPDGSTFAAGQGGHPSYVLLVMNPSPADQFGTWNGVGWHYALVDWYDPGGYYCGGWNPCHLWTDQYYLGSSSDQVSASPPPSTAMIVMRTFIPDEWIFSPVMTYELFSGDNRGFCETCGSARYEVWGTYRNPALGQGLTAENPQRAVSITEKYDYFTSIDENWHISSVASPDYSPEPR